MAGRPELLMRSRARSSSAVQRVASTTCTTMSAPSRALAAVRFIALLRAREALWCSPGVSTKAISASGRREIPTMRWRVVWGRGVTILTFWPTRALSRVDLPTLGRPTRAAKPLWNSGDGVCDMALAYPTGGSPGARYDRAVPSGRARALVCALIFDLQNNPLRSLLLRATPAEPLPLAATVDIRD